MRYVLAYYVAIQMLLILRNIT